MSHSPGITKPPDTSMTRLPGSRRFPAGEISTMRSPRITMSTSVRGTLPATSMTVAPARTSSASADREVRWNAQAAVANRTARQGISRMGDDARDRSRASCASFRRSLSVSPLPPSYASTFATRRWLRRRAHRDSRVHAVSLRHCRRSQPFDSRRTPIRESRASGGPSTAPRSDETRCARRTARRAPARPSCYARRDDARSARTVVRTPRRRARR